MTDEEKAEITKEYLNKTFKQTEANQLAIMIGSKCFYEGLEKGLAEGRKEGYEQGKNNERELQCGKKNYEKDLAKLEKENARLSNSVTELTNTKTELENKITELKAQIKKMKCCGNCINRGLEKYVAYPCSECKRWHRELEVDKWELAE